MTDTLPDPALLPAALRRPAASAVALAALVFAVLTVRYAGTSAPGRVDDRIESMVDPVGAAHVWTVSRATVLGSPPFVVLAAFLLAALCFALGRRRLALLAVAGPGITGLATTVLKPLIGRTIGAGFAFPSGHTGGATSLALVVALVAISLIRPGRATALAVLAGCAVLVGGGVGAALVAADAHYPTDTIGGFCTAVVVVLGLALVLDRASGYRPRRRAMRRTRPSTGR